MTGPCHIRGPVHAASVATATTHATTTATGWVPATAPPSELPVAAGTDRRQASSAATRPTVTATTMDTALSWAKANV
nr:hypothetical protein CPGR_05459 [Mycolicibacterium fortuitum subsp. fortuitum DSM 46621 = ATCC 6841 = JCM 6387]